MAARTAGARPGLSQSGLADRLQIVPSNRLQIVPSDCLQTAFRSCLPNAALASATVVDTAEHLIPCAVHDAIGGTAVNRFLDRVLAIPALLHHTSRPKLMVAVRHPEGLPRHAGTPGAANTGKLIHPQHIRCCVGLSFREVHWPEPSLLIPSEELRAVNLRERPWGGGGGLRCGIRTGCAVRADQGGR